MLRLINKIILPLLILLICSVSAGSNRQSASVPGSRVRQLMLKQALEKYISGTLVEELNRNKRLWAKMSPEELRKLRSRYYAFLKENPDKQVELIEAAEKFQKLTAEQRKAYIKRAEWLKKVVSHLTEKEKEALKKMTPAQRAKRLLELKAIYCTSQPTTQPTTRTTSQPFTVPATQPATRRTKIIKDREDH